MAAMRGDDSAHGSRKFSEKALEHDSPVKLFTVPVDSENKSKVFKFWSWQRPHHQAMQLSWISFFVAFIATFAAPPLMPVIRDNLNLTKPDISGASIAAVTGAVFSRITMGTVCDAFGPRYGHGVLQLLTASATFGMAAVTNSAGFIACRMLIGFSLATFVACQFWCSTMFNARIVGTANAVAAGWGNMGGGFTQLIMPHIMSGIAQSQPKFIAWRCAFFIPGWCQVLIGIIVLLFGQDLPDGNYAELKKAGKKDKSKTHMELWAAVKNYRTWVLVLTYGYSFGVELTVDNNIATYLHDQFNLSVDSAGNLACIFGMANLFTRALGGILSDYVAKSTGMRGRLWVLWIVQTLGGVMSILMYYTDHSLGLTMMIVVFWSFLVPMACGATYGVAPFITRRGLGVATGLVGSGGNAGSAITNAIFFTSASMTMAEGFLWMGVMICGMTLLVTLIHFPMWGGMFTRGNPAKTEEEYYASDYTDKEREQGLHRAILNWANESRSQRGFKSTLDQLGLPPVEVPVAAKQSNVDETPAATNV